MADRYGVERPSPIGTPVSSATGCAAQTRLPTNKSKNVGEMGWMVMKYQGLLAGLLGCFFGILGIFTFGLIFVPLAAICSVVGLLRGASGASISGVGCSLLAAVLTVWGFAVSPSLWLLTGIFLAANHHQSTTASLPERREFNRLIDNSNNSRDAIGALSSPSVPTLPRDRLSPAASASATPTPAYTDIPPKPADEVALIAAIISARNQYNSGRNDMAKGEARFARKQALCNLMKTAEVSNWIGKATSLTTTSGYHLTEESKLQYHFGVACAIVRHAQGDHH